jgi:hypothetical protein
VPMVWRTVVLQSNERGCPGLTPAGSEHQGHGQPIDIVRAAL